MSTEEKYILQRVRDLSEALEGGGKLGGNGMAMDAAELPFLLHESVPPLAGPLTVYKVASKKYYLVVGGDLPVQHFVARPQGEEKAA